MCVVSKSEIKTGLAHLEHELRNLEFVVIQKDDKGYKKLLSKLTSLHLNSFDKKVNEAVKKCIKYLTSVGGDSFNSSHLKYVQTLFKTSIGVELPELLESDVLALNSQIYRFGIGEVGKSVKLKLAFDVADEEAAAVLGQQNLFWVQDYYGSQLSGEIDRVLKPYFTSDKTIGDVIDDFKKSFQKLTDKGSDYFEGLAEHTTNRTRELGKITGYEKAGVEKYEIRAVIDDRTSDVCLEMDGQIFEVSSGVEFRDTILSLDDPEQIKAVAPWRTGSEISGLSTADLPPGMELPPYHWRCRTVTVAYFE